jgi:hypothetical protein
VTRGVALAVSDQLSAKSFQQRAFSFERKVFICGELGGNYQTEFGKE